MADLLPIPEGWVARSTERVWTNTDAEAAYRALEDLAQHARAQAVSGFTQHVARADAAAHAKSRDRAIHQASGEIDRVMAKLIEAHTTIRVVYGPPAP